MSWGQAFIKTCENYTRLHSCFKPRPPAGSYGRCPSYTCCHPQYLSRDLRSLLTRIFSRILQRVGSGDNHHFKSSVCSAFAYFNSKFIKWMTGLEPAPVSLSVRSSILAELHSCFFRMTCSKVRWLHLYPYYLLSSSRTSPTMMFNLQSFTYLYFHVLITNHFWVLRLAVGVGATPFGT